MMIYDHIVNVKNNRGFHLGEDSSTLEKELLQKELKREWKEKKICFPSLREHNQRPDHHPFNRWWDLTFGDEGDTDRLLIGESYRSLEILAPRE